MAEPVPDSIELAGDGLCLRPYRREDAGALVAAARESVESVGRWLAWCHAGYAGADAEGWIAHCAEGWRSGEHYAFAVFDAGSAGFCGSVGLNQRNRAHNFMNLGYWIRESPKMAYKSKFEPIEGFMGGVWRRLGRRQTEETRA